MRYVSSMTKSKNDVNSNLMIGVILVNAAYGVFGEVVRSEQIKNKKPATISGSGMEWLIECLYVVSRNVHPHFIL